MLRNFFVIIKHIENCNCFPDFLKFTNITFFFKKDSSFPFYSHAIYVINNHVARRNWGCS